MNVWERSAIRRLLSNCRSRSFSILRRRWTTTFNGSLLALRTRRGTTWLVSWKDLLCLVHLKNRWIPLHRNLSKLLSPNFSLFRREISNWRREEKPIVKKHQCFVQLRSVSPNEIPSHGPLSPLLASASSDSTLVNVPISSTSDFLSESRLKFRRCE